jgi:urea transport system substrate-binding protein
MAACGLPTQVDDHAARLARMALDMQQALEAINETLPERLELRIGLNTGPVVAGVIGDQKFIYDMWGDAVNVASRMESHGEAGAIQVSASVHEILKDDFVFEARGEIDIKGKGPMQTWWLKDERA